MRPEHSEHPELTGRQVGDKWDYGETSGRQVGDKPEIMRPEQLRAYWETYWETSGKQMGDKYLGDKYLGDNWETSGDKWETSIKSCGQSTERIQSLLGDKWETSGRQVGDKGEIMRPGTQARRQTQNHPARACTPLKGVRTPHR